VVIDLKIGTSGPKQVPQIVLLLDDDTHVVNVNRSLAGTRFASISSERTLHDQLHPDCPGDCEFSKLWNTAWASLQQRDSVEWEIDDARLQRLLRLNLSRPPAPKAVERDRRKPYKLLTITDITKHRRDYQTLIEQQEALVRLLKSHGLEQSGGDEAAFDESGDTGNRLMAAFIQEDQSFGRQLLLAQECERRRIAAELHDSIAQSISVLKFKIESNIAQMAQAHPEVDLQIFDSAVGDLQDLIEEVRRISSNLAPSMLQDFGLQVSIEWLVREFKAQNPDTDVRCETLLDECDTPDVVRIAVFRVVQEALNNISKHASASRVDVSVTGDREHGLRVVIADDGSGFEAADLGRRRGERDKLGLRSMRERIEAAGGTFDIRSGAGKGVVITAKWSVQELETIR